MNVFERIIHESAKSAAKALRQLDSERATARRGVTFIPAPPLSGIRLTKRADRRARKAPISNRDVHDRGRQYRHEVGEHWRVYPPGFQYSSGKTRQKTKRVWIDKYEKGDASLSPCMSTLYRHMALGIAHGMRRAA